VISVIVKASRQGYDALTEAGVLENAGGDRFTVAVPATVPSRWPYSER